MSLSYRLSSISIALASLLALSGCGSQAYRGPSSSQTVKKTFTAEEVTAEEDTDDAEQSSATGKTGVPAYSVRVASYGYSTVKMKVKANKVLKVRFTPGQQDRAVRNTGAQLPYTHLGVYLGVEDHSEPTPMLSNGLLEAAASSGVLNLSNQFTRTCGSDTNCRQDVEIIVSKPNNDVNWYNKLRYLQFFWEHVPEDHPWNGTLLIQTDDTDEI